MAEMDDRSTGGVLMTSKLNASDAIVLIVNDFYMHFVVR
jgi:hypothetical protein